MARTDIPVLESADLLLFLKPAVIFVATVALAAVAVQTPTGVSQLPALASLPLLFVLPGYAIITVLFRPEQAVVSGEHRRVTRVLERASLSVVGSLLTSTFIGFGILLSPFALSRGNIVISLASITTIAVLFMLRNQLQKRGEPAERSSFGVELLSGWQRYRPQTKVVVVLLVTSLLFATGAMSYALTTEIRGEQYTEFYILTENESDQLVADDYPTTFTQDDPRSLTVGVTNRERLTTQYSIVVELQQIQRSDNQTQVVAQEELTRYQTRLRPTETSNRTVQLEPSMVGEDLRLVFLLYTEDPPSDPATDSAYRDIHLWITVTPSG